MGCCPLGKGSKMNSQWVIISVVLPDPCDPLLSHDWCFHQPIVQLEGSHKLGDIQKVSSTENILWNCSAGAESQMHQHCLLTQGFSRWISGLRCAKELIRKGANDQPFHQMTSWKSAIHLLDLRGTGWEDVLIRWFNQGFSDCFLLFWGDFWDFWKL